MGLKTKSLPISGYHDMAYYHSHMIHACIILSVLQAAKLKGKKHSLQGNTHTYVCMHATMHACMYNKKDRYQFHLTVDLPIYPSSKN